MEVSARSRDARPACVVLAGWAASETTAHLVFSFATTAKVADESIHPVALPVGVAVVHLEDVSLCAAGTLDAKVEVTHVAARVGASAR